MKLAYVTGATGFIGKNLILELVKEDWKVVVLHRRSSDLSRLKGIDVSFAEVDLSSLESVRNSIPEQVDCIYHVAGNGSHWAREAEQQWVDNVMSTRNLVAIALERKCTRFILTSTGATEPYRSYDERQTNAHIKNGYIRTKRLAELEVYAGMEQGLDAIILQPIIVIGAHDYNHYSQIFTDLKSQSLKVVPPGKISFCHGQDIAKAHITAFEKGRSCEHYVLGGEYTTWLDLFQRISKVVGVKPPTKATPKFLLSIFSYILVSIAFFTNKRPQITPELVSLLGDTSAISFYERKKAFEDLDYQSASLDEMIQNCHEWLLKENRYPDTPSAGLETSKLPS